MNLPRESNAVVYALPWIEYTYSGGPVSIAEIGKCAAFMGVRHNANYVAYTQLPGCTLCSVTAE